MIFSKTCRYAIRSVVYISSLNRGEEYIPIHQISQRLDISFTYLTKIFQKLTKAGVLNSNRGAKGGVTLARAPQDISLLNIISIIDGESMFTECALGLPGCGCNKPCPVHEKIAGVREQLKTICEGTTISNLAKDVDTLDLRLYELGIN
ncbi:Rrf2 family transcriptional regulator [Deltaproteobacteria bacterium TL4]